MKTILCIVWVFLVCSAGVAADHADDEYRANKMQSALNAASATIGASVAAAADPASNAAATQMSQMYAEAGIDRSVSNGEFNTVAGMKTGARKLLQQGTFSRGFDDRSAGVAYEVQRGIGQAVAAGTPQAGQQAARTGGAMGIIATTPGSYFAVDHIKSSGPKRLLRGTTAVSADHPDYEKLWAMQNTAEAIQSLGADATGLGAVQANAASGFKGNSVMGQKQFDVMAHQRAVDLGRSTGGARKLKALLV